MDKPFVVGGIRSLEIFVIYGDSEDIKSMTKKFQGNRKMDQVRLIVT